MPKIVQLEPDIAVAPQLAAADFAELAARGFRSVVDIRPDGEAQDQLPNAQAAAIAREHGLAFRYLPVRSLNITEDEVVGAFTRLMADLPAPILFYCGTSTRCATLWAQAAAPRLGVDTVLDVARASGYQLDFLRGLLSERAEWHSTTPLLPAAARAMRGRAL
jgi:sulfide:quinone oxidoreductase